jgi:hypothetical protein
MMLLLSNFDNAVRPINQSMDKFIALFINGRNHIVEASCFQ